MVMDVSETIARMRAGERFWLAHLSGENDGPGSGYAGFRLTSRTFVYVKTATAELAYMKNNGLGRFDLPRGERYLVRDTFENSADVSRLDLFSNNYTLFFSAEDLIKSVRIMAEAGGRLGAFEGMNSEAKAAEFMIWLDCGGMG